ncbi:hypothetical protein GH714_002036 [Hevea brasiliensis]|uniref:PSP proline-rich domain-containing protein n=1 Tax=Hevea brasiliensis TaxID=3981 RepID=A0A6A6LUJ4_HEVBR|nr:hypothetical protein GH714_002036 [Hevea brasiliensis]
MAADTLPYQNGVVSNGDLATNPSSNNANAKKSRDSERRRRRRKQKKNNKTASQALDATANSNKSDDDDSANGDDAKENNDPQQAFEQVVVEYVPEKAELEAGLDDEFRKIFERFNFHEIAGSEENDKKDESAQNADSKKKVDSDSEEEEQDYTQKEKGVSNKKKKLLRRMKIAELKQICSRPDVVEVWDATAADPKLLVFLKSYRNTVPVPRHWCQKRKFLQGKRGIEKQPFQLPDFIAATGIEKIRQVLHDAFFKYQTKPKLTTHGDLYHEGKEFERYGPPPSYPHLKIPGLNAPIPPGASFGYHPGGWGKPPLMNMVVLCMEMFLEFSNKNSPIMRKSQLIKPSTGVTWRKRKRRKKRKRRSRSRKRSWRMAFNLWIASRGIVELVASYFYLWFYAQIQALCTPTGVETPDVIDLRKQQRKEPERPLYQVLEEKEERIAPGTLLGTTHTYVVASGTQDKSAAKRVDLLRGQKTDRVDVTLQPEELDALDNVLPAKYEEAREEEKCVANVRISVIWLQSGSPPPGGPGRALHREAKTKYKGEMGLSSKQVSSDGLDWSQTLWQQAQTLELPKPSFKAATATKPAAIRALEVPEM